ncbi:MAG: WD40 repeat domain-containing protein [Planctomycetes bacterium]|nr:WD40 repeat domain-containing protein [Planctomycetota bacterium]
MLQQLTKDGHLPRKVAAYANAVRELGNVGTHVFGEPVPVTPADVTRSLQQLLVVLEWYFESERPPEKAGATAPSRKTMPPSGHHPAGEVAVLRPSALPRRWKAGILGLGVILLLGLISLGAWLGWRALTGLHSNNSVARSADTGQAGRGEAGTRPAQGESLPSSSAGKATTSSTIPVGPPGEALTLQGHQGTINGVAFSADDRRLYSVSLRDKTIRVWSADGGQQLAKTNLPARVNSSQGLPVLFSTDGRRLLLGTPDNSLVLVDSDSGQVLQSLVGHTNRVGCAALSTDGHRALSGSDDGTVRLWNLDDGQELLRLQVEHPPGQALALSGDGKRGLIASEGPPEARVRLVDLEGASGRDGAVPVQNREILHLGKYPSSVNVLVLTPDGRYAVCAEYHSHIPLSCWDLEAKTERRFDALNQFTRCLAMTPDGRRVVSGEDDGLLLWDLPTGKVIRKFSGKGSIWAVALSHDGRRAVSGGMDEIVRVWNLPE